MPRADAVSALVAPTGGNAPLPLVDLRKVQPVRIGSPSGVAHNGSLADGRAL